MQPDDDKTQTHLVLTSGTMISHYRIIEKIGAGGMGEVYLAEDTELDRKVALKFLPPHLCQDADCRARFKREAQATAKLDHPNIFPWAADVLICPIRRTQVPPTHENPRRSGG